MKKVQSVILPCALMGCLVVIWFGTIAAAGVPSGLGLPLVAQAAPAVSSAAQPANNSSGAAAQCTVSHLYPASITRWCELITKYAGASGLPANLVAAVMLQESGGNPQAFSTSGAVGLLQVMPRDGIAANFTCPGGPCFASRPTITELYDPDTNLAYGTRLLAVLLARNNDDLRLALRSYGPMDVGFSYADKVMAIYQRYQ